MSIVALCMARNEADVIGGVVEHLFVEGVDLVVVEDGHSDDRTRYAALDAGAIVIDETDRAYDQPERMTRFAREWCSPGDWFLPFDADEYWYSDQGTIAEALTNTSASICSARMFLHLDWDHRSKEPKPLPKVAFRYSLGARLVFGNHAVHGVEGDTQWGVLDLREWQYRNFDHFVAKVRKQRELVKHTPGLDGQFATHKRAWLTMSDSQLEAEWVRMQAGDWVFDPIPARSSSRPSDVHS